MLVGYPLILSLHIGRLAKQLNHQEAFIQVVIPLLYASVSLPFRGADNAAMFAFVKMFEVFGQWVVRTSA